MGLTDTCVLMDMLGEAGKSSFYSIFSSPCLSKASGRHSAMEWAALILPVSFSVALGRKGVLLSPRYPNKPNTASPAKQNRLASL